MLNDEACVLSAQRMTLRNFWFAIQSIDERFGKGYAQEHPELLGAFLQAIATENSALRHMAGLSETIKELAAKLSLSTNAQ